MAHWAIAGAWGDVKEWRRVEGETIGTAGMSIASRQEPARMERNVVRIEEGGVSSQGTSRGRSFTLLAGAQLGIAWHEVTANQSSTIEHWDGIHPWI